MNHFFVKTLLQEGAGKKVSGKIFKDYGLKESGTGGYGIHYLFHASDTQELE